jgi:hypothetical protein
MIYKTKIYSYFASVIDTGYHRDNSILDRDHGNNVSLTLGENVLELCQLM